MHAPAACARTVPLPTARRSLERLSGKLRAAMRPEALRRAETDLELLMQAEGSAMRPGPRPLLPPGLLAALRHAILASSEIGFSYQRAEQTKRVARLAHPLGLLHGQQSYLVASLPGTPGDPTLFRLDRMHELRIGKHSFTRDTHFNLSAYASRSFGVFQEDPISVCLRFSPASAPDARNFHFHPTQTLENAADGALLVRFEAGGREEMIRHILTWRAEVTIVSPDTLRLSLLSFLRQASAHHRHPRDAGCVGGET